MDHRLQASPCASDRFLAENRLLSDIDLAEVLRILWRRRIVILGSIAAIVGLMAAYVFTVEPHYTTEAMILIDGKVSPVLDFQAAVTGQPQDEASVISEIEVIKSRTLAWRVIRKTGLDSRSEFNEKLREENPVVVFVKGMLPEGLLWQTEDKKLRDLPEERRQEFGQQKIIDKFMSLLDARQIPRSRAVLVEFTSKSPEVAADVVNSIAELYLTARLEDKFENAKRANTWLSARMTELREDLENAEWTVEEYRRQHELFRTDRGTLLENQIADLNTRLTDATIGRQAAEANLADARRLLRSPRQTEVETASEVLKSPLVQRFREEELLLERKEAEMSEQFGARHPLMIQLQAEKKRLKEKLRLEIGKIVSGLENEVQVVRGREAALNRDIQALKTQMVQANQASIGLDSLERNAEAKRLLLQKFMTAFMETSAQEDVGSQLPDARIISQAPIPDKPSFPKKALMLAIALVGATVVGVVSAFVLEHLDAGFRSAEQIEEATGLPVLAHVPIVHRTATGGQDLSCHVLRRPKSAFADAIRSVYTRLMLTPVEHSSKVVLLTSAVANEGKTTVALALARQQLQAGRRVVVVDADFCRSQMANRIPGIAPSPGLSDVLAGTATAKSVVQSDSDGTLDMIVAGTNKQKRMDIGDSTTLRGLLDELGRHYDIIIIDSAPILAVPDTHVFASLADATLMVISWGSTRRRVVCYALNQIARFGGQLHGVILSKVNVKKHASYGYGDSGNYYGDVAKYYEA
jgi:polysaccharide biosynthesis transport protein